MNTHSRMKRWLPIALCCLPGVAVAVIVGISAAFSGALLNPPLRLGLIALAMLACPLSMGLMMRHASHRDSASNSSRAMADRCTQAEQATMVESDRLAALRARREALEREVTQLERESEQSLNLAHIAQGGSPWTH